MPAQARPVADVNSIEAVAFGVVLARAVGAAEVERVAALRNVLREELPGFERQPGLSLDIGPGLLPGGLVPTTAMAGGVTFFRADAAGRKEWQLSLAPNQVVVTCQRYTRWREVWPRAHKLLVMTLRLLDQMHPVQEVGMQIVDRFVYDERPAEGEYSIADVFREDCSYLTRKAFSSGMLWHVHQGWFEQAPAQLPNSRLLHQLDLSSGELLPVQQLVNTIDHRAVLRPLPATAFTLDQFLAGPSEYDTPLLSAVYLEMHQRNKSLFEECVSAAMAERVQLGVE